MPIESAERTKRFPHHISYLVISETYTVPGEMLHVQYGRRMDARVQPCVRLAPIFQNFSLFISFRLHNCLVDFSLGGVETPVMASQ